MDNAIKQFAAIWKKLGVNQKVTILFLIVALLAGIVALVYISRRPSFELLYSDLNEKDMAQVVSFLKESKVPYRVIGGGKAVMVPERKKYDLRLGLADKGLISGEHAGLELWEGPGWGASRLAEQMWKRRAIQGELARTITHIEQLAWVDVQIAQPEPSLFVEDQKPTTAAISLRLNPGRALTPVQIAGICRLVAGSVEGLESRNVTIIDERGNLLTSAHDDAAGAVASNLQNYQQNYEEYLAAKAQAMLDRALGAGKSVVKVSAVLDMDRISETSETYDTANKVARKEKMHSTSSSGGGTGGGAGSSSEEVIETSYDVPKTIRTIQSTPGTVKRLDVAVILDPTYLDAEGNEAAFSQQQLDDLGLIVKRAVGLDEAGTRKDIFQLTAMNFHKRPEPDFSEEIEKQQKQQYLLQIAKYGSSIVAVVVFLVVARIALKRAGRNLQTPSPSGESTPFAPGAEMLALQGGGRQGHLRNRAKEIMARDPQTAARLLQRWISEEDNGRKG